ncbi:MAG TPA: 2OG-Fe(II) oxygenase [Nitrospirales bacterium]|nr:2OG-Fe(II) oxygenase [Nitrospirales bacterium]HIB53851.1 2OG-Fe(II) oxygenase [Nitrospirales bacterium]HIO21458.1 2OG-Fe(II) oxygenase [Nitrospirales bacterium]
MAFRDIFKQHSRKDAGGVFVFDQSELSILASTHKTTYNEANPFPHVVIDDFLPAHGAHQALAEFPPPDAPLWLDWTKRDTIHQPKKLGVGSAERLAQASPSLQHILFTLNSYAMIEFLETLTGIQGLIPDPHFTGGGLHQILPGGKLAIHSDFNFDSKLKLYRRINTLIFLNIDWKEEYGGHLELWDSTMTRCVQRVLPIFNRCVIFNTDKDSCHGHPEPLNTPDHITRKSLALYYYSRDPKEGDNDIRTTDWRIRPGEAE